MTMTKFIPAVLLAAFVLSSPAPAEAAPACNEAEAKGIVEAIVQGGIAERELVGIVTYYHWRTGWYDLPFERQYKMINGLTGVEKCLRGEIVTTRITFLGRDVAYGSSSGVEVLHSRP